MESAVEPNLAHELGKKCKWNELEITTWRVKMCFKLLLKGNTFSAKTQIKRNGMGKCRKRDSQRKRISALLEIKITHTQRITKMLKSARKCTKKEIAFNTLDTHKSELEKGPIKGLLTKLLTNRFNAQGQLIIAPDFPFRTRNRVSV